MEECDFQYRDLLHQADQVKKRYSEQRSAMIDENEQALLLLYNHSDSLKKQLEAYKKQAQEETRNAKEDYANIIKEVQVEYS